MHKFIIGLMCFLFLSTSWAEENAATFNVKLATEKLVQINKNLTAPHTTPGAYLNAIETIDDLIKEALLCTTETQKELNEIEGFIKQSTKLAEPTITADLIYLKKEQKKWTNIQAECRLFMIQASEEIDAYKHKIIILREKATLSRSTPIWTLYQTLPHTHDTIGLNIIKLIEANTILTCTYAYIALPTALLFALLFLFSVRKTTFSVRYLHYKKIKPLYIVLLTLSLNCAILLGPFLFNLDVHDVSSELIRPLGLFCLYFSSWFALIFTFKIKSFRALLDWYNLNYRFARACLFFVLTAFITAFLGQWFVDMQIYPPATWQFIKTIYLYTVLFVCFAYVVYYCHSKHTHHWVKTHSLGFQLSTLALLSIPMVLGTMGYLSLGLQLLYAGFVLLVILFFMSTLMWGSEKLYRYTHNYAPLKQRLAKYLGYKAEDTLTEFFILKVAIQLVVLIFGLFLMIKSTGFSTETIDAAYEQFVNGIHMGNVILYPTRIVLGIIVFCLLYLTSRLISTKISARQQFEDEEETQVAVASLLTYIGFLIAAIVGALIAGFDFTGLAIIAGALSVGIGLGLQSIVNNFVSGLILLIEKPIKPGDRIAIGGIEGVVKKIRVRSTQIMSSAREDIIIPNSDLITQRVVNFMLTDKYCRISFDITAAYGSDTYLVRDSLLEIAHKHDEVVKTERNKPIALLLDFGENALVFQLTCLIKDVNKKAIVRSDINFEIERIFRERHIDMPFVQREIHIRASDLKLT